MKYFLPIFFATLAVFFTFGAIKYGSTVADKTAQVSKAAVHAKPVASFVKFIFSR